MPGTSALDGIRVVGPHGGLLRQAIHALKYGRRQAVAVPLATLLAERWQAAGVAIDGVIPVPLHPARLRERGYNQADLLARAFSQFSQVPLREALLERVRATPPQVGLDRSSRLANVSGAFEAAPAVAGGRWLLIDDVCTSGATLEACAGAIRRAGGAAIWALALARPHDGFHDERNTILVAAIV